MHDIKAIRENPNAFDAGWAKRGLSAQSAALLDLDAQLRTALTAKQEAEAARNAASKEIGKAKAAKDETRAQALMEAVAKAKETIDQTGAKEVDLAKQMHDILAALPNIPAADVPEGEDETKNKIEKHWDAVKGASPSLEGRGQGEGEQHPPPLQNLPVSKANAPKDHVALGEALGMMDFEAAAKMSGARFVVLKGALARMERALAAFMIDQHTEENGYTECAPPLLVRGPAAFGTGQLPKFEEDLFSASATTLARVAQEYGLPAFKRILGRRSQGEEFSDESYESEWLQEVAKDVREAGLPTGHLRESFFLTPTAEVSLTNLVREQITESESLPLRLTADTPCFRSEAGAAGKDTRGMIRMHQFRKVELVSITTPEASEHEHERMTRCAEKILEALELPYRRMLLCTGDMGFSARKTYDLEVWLPSQNKYREISSCSNCGDFQARRMDARFRRKGEKKTEFVHTLNGSGLAVGRTLVAILENYQNPDGSIAIPAALRAYMGGRETITA